MAEGRRTRRVKRRERPLATFDPVPKTEAPADPPPGEIALPSARPRHPADPEPRKELEARQRRWLIEREKAIARETASES